jgi:hypothetical protein
LRWGVGCDNDSTGTIIRDLNLGMDREVLTSMEGERGREREGISRFAPVDGLGERVGDVKVGMDEMDIGRVNGGDEGSGNGSGSGSGSGLERIVSIRTIKTPGRLPSIMLRGKTDDLPQ